MVQPLFLDEVGLLTLSLCSPYSQVVHSYATNGVYAPIGSGR